MFNLYEENKIKSIKFWKISEGTHLVNFIPTLNANRLVKKCNTTFVFEITIHQHPAVGRILCLDMLGKQCPICKFSNENENMHKYMYKRQKRAIYNMQILNDLEYNDEVVIAELNSWYFHKQLVNISLQTHQEEPELNSTKPTCEEIIAYVKALKQYKLNILQKGQLTPFHNIFNEYSVRFSCAKSNRFGYYEYFGFKLREREQKISNRILNSVHSLENLIHIPTYKEAADFLMALNKV